MKYPKCIVLLFILFSLTIEAKEVYVSLSGNDSNTGTLNSPYKTFAKAVSVMNPGDVCIIRGGIYTEELSVKKNGTSNAYLTFKAAEGEEVHINATKTLSNWQLHSGNIYKVNVTMNIESQFRAVYHNNSYMDLARWPNNTDDNRWTVDCHPVDGGSASHFDVKNIPNIDWSGGLVYYLGAHSGASWTRQITSNTASRINFSAVDINKWPFSTHNPTVWRGYPGNNRGQFYLFNKLEALDYAREWFYDQSAKVLYFQPADGQKPEDGSVAYASSRYTAQIEGDYVKLDGLHFFGGAVKIHRNANNNIIENCSITHGVEGHDDLSNTSAQVSHAAIEIYGFKTTVKGCSIDQSAFNGIIAHSWAGAHETHIEKNYISNTDYVGIHASPIRTSADRVKVIKNTIKNTGRDGMYVNGSDCEIAYNDVAASQKINADSGMFYVVGNSNLKNTEIHHNWFHDATAPSYSHEPGKPGKAAGIYLDNNSKGYSVHHNVVWNVSWSGYQVNWNNTYLDFFHNTIWNAERAMDSWVNGYSQENNRVYNNFANTGDWHTETASDFDIKNNIIANITPFENPENKDFMPKSGSELIDTARIISDFELPFFGNAPDVGAYELGGTKWTAGVDAIEDAGEGRTWNIFDTDFKIAVISETCPNKNNGQIRITTDDTGEYIINFKGSNTTFSNEKVFTNISPGEYELCIYVNNKPERQCFNVNIAQGKTLAVSSSFSTDAYNVIITDGTPPFTISINGAVVKKTMLANTAVTVNQGDVLKVSSSVACEGERVETIDFFGEVAMSPNPTYDDVIISLPIQKGSLPITLFNIDAKVLSSAQYTIENGKVIVPLSAYPPGIYFIKISAKTNKVLKIIKK